MTQFTISQALRKIKRLKGPMGELSSRAASSVSYLADQKPSFDFAETRKKLDEAREELIKLRSGVAAANGVTLITWEDKQITLAEGIARLQEFKAEMSWLQALNLQEGSTTESYYDYDDNSRRVRCEKVITWKSHLSETSRVDEIDTLKDKFEDLNSRVESANHSTRLKLE